MSINVIGLVLLPVVLAINIRGLESASSRSANIQPVDDTTIRFKCTCGHVVDTSDLVSVPVSYNSRLYYKTYFTISPFIKRFFDYISLVRDTVFIIRGGEDSLDQNSIDQRQILCILNTDHRIYERKKMIELPFLSCLVFEKKSFDRKNNTSLFTFYSESCGHSETSDIPFIKEVTFDNRGKIVSFVFDNVDCVWECKKISS